MSWLLLQALTYFLPKVSSDGLQSPWPCKEKTVRGWMDGMVPITLINIIKSNLDYFAVRTIKSRNLPFWLQEYGSNLRPCCVAHLKSEMPLWETSRRLLIPSVSWIFLTERTKYCIIAVYHRVPVNLDRAERETVRVKQEDNCPNPKRELLPTTGNPPARPVHFSALKAFTSIQVWDCRADDGILTMPSCYAS